MLPIGGHMSNIELRDYLAGQALQALLQGDAMAFAPSMSSPEQRTARARDLAQTAYVVADAMVATRAQKAP
jgi:hypothetical protein